MKTIILVSLNIFIYLSWVNEELQKHTFSFENRHSKKQLMGNAIVGVFTDAVLKTISSMVISLEEFYTPYPER